MNKIKCDLKKSGQRSEKRNHHAIKKPLNAFDYSEDEENEKSEIVGKVEIVKGIKNGQVVIDKEKLNAVKDTVSLNFINSLENKLSRIKNKKKIIYLNFPKPDDEFHSDEHKIGKTSRQAEDTDRSLSICSSEKIVKRRKKNSSDKEINITDEANECNKKKNPSTPEIKETNQSVESEYDNKNDRSNESHTSDETTKSDTSSLQNDLDILPNFSTSLKGSNNDDNPHITSVLLNKGEQNNMETIPETSLAYKRKQFLEKINKKEEEFIFKNELNLYKEFKNHNIEIENYGKQILNKMGYDEKIYNAYINKYYEEHSDSNYFDKIYEQFQARTFRFTGIGTEEEMEKNLEEIKREQEQEMDANITKAKETMNETIYTKKEDKEKEYEKKKKNYENHFEKNEEDWKSDKYDSYKRKKKRKKENDYYSDEDNKKKINQDLFEGLIVKINLKTHEHYKRKGIVIFKKKKKDEVYYGLLLFKNYELINIYKKKIKNKIEEAYEKNYDDVKYFWISFINGLNKMISLEKEEKRYDTYERKKKIIDPFDLTEVKGKYLETVVTSDSYRCKIVNTRLQHPQKKKIHI